MPRPTPISALLRLPWFHQGLRDLPGSPGVLAECRRAAAAAGAGLAVALVVAGCGAGPTLPEDELFREASLALEDESYTTAISDYKKLLEEYPFSDKAEIASLNIAFAHYLNNEHNEAIVAFNDFERLYPVSPLLPFVSYTIGMCWLDQARDGERDATPSDEALRQFRKVENEFPGTLYADLSAFRQQQARENLAAHELVVGDYYRQRKKFEAAMGRYEFILKEYPTTQNAARASARLQEMQQLASSSVKPAAPASETTTPAAATPPTPPAGSAAPAGAPVATAPASTNASPASASGEPAGGDPAAKF